MCTSRLSTVSQVHVSGKGGEYPSHPCRQTDACENITFPRMVMGEPVAQCINLTELNCRKFTTTINWNSKSINMQSNPNTKYNKELFRSLVVMVRPAELTFSGKIILIVDIGLKYKKCVYIYLCISVCYNWKKWEISIIFFTYYQILSHENEAVK